MTIIRTPTGDDANAAGTGVAIGGTVVPRTAIRETLGTGDSFRPTANAFPTVPASYLGPLKMQEVALTNEAGATESKLVLDRVLIDLASIDPATMDPQRMIRDCEYVRELLIRHPDAPRRIAAA